MKNKLKKSHNPDLQTVRPAKRRLNILRLTGFALGLSVLLALFALLVIGLPPGMTRRITAQVQQAGIPLQVNSIRLSTHRGWVLSNFRLYSTSPDDLQPLLSAKKLYVSLLPVDWKKPAEGGWHIKVFVRDLGVSLGRPWESVLPESHPFRTVSKLQASLTAAPGRVTVEKADLRWGDVSIRANGTTFFSAGGEARQSTNDFRRRAAKAVNILSRLKCEKPPQLNLTFNYNDARPEETFLDAALSAKGIYLRDRSYEKLSGTFGYRDSIWTLSGFQLNRSDLEKLTLRGTYNVESSNVQVSVENTLSASDLFSLLPEDAQSATAQTGIKPYGRFDFTAALGPAPYDRLAEKIDAQVQLAQLKRQDLTLDPLAFRLVRDGSRIELSGIETRANGGPLTGRFEFDLNSKAWIAQAKAQCNPVPIGTLTGGGLQEFISRFSFPAEQMKADLTVSQEGPGELLFIAGTLAGDRFTCGGVPIGHLETFMVYSNRVLNLTPLHITRDKEQFDGSVQVDFARGLAFFNATNSFPPVDIARVLAPEKHTVLEQFLFNGPVYAAGSGQLDYGSWTNHDFGGTFRSENISLGKLRASSINSDVKVNGTQLLFTNATVRLYGGLTEGSAEFDILLEDGSAPYRIDARATGFNLAQVLGQFSTNDHSRTRGQLSAVIDFTADAKAGFWKSVRGKGRVEVKDGRLAELPLFGGFSRLTQSAFPGFNLFSLTAFSADYELHDGAVWSENAQLGGTIFSALGRGSYSPERGLDFTVAAQPLRQTDGSDTEWYQLHRLAAVALKEGTSPFFRLLEFKLEGPLDKPEWRFANLPKGTSEPAGRSPEK